MPVVPQASSIAGGVDSVFLFIVALSAVFLLFITFLMIWFSIRYRRSRNPKGKDIRGNTWLEIVWTATPTVLFLLMFFYGWTNYRHMRNVPRDAMVITVTARQWSWSFTYPNGKHTTRLYLAYGKPVKLELRSLDVIHGFFVPAFRIKEDVVPGKQNYTWFSPTLLGTFDIECTVICGIDHANMLSKVVVVPVEDFEKWYFGDVDTPEPMPKAKETAAAGEPANPALAVLEKNSCLTCHSLDGKVAVGPTFKGMYGRRETVYAGDEAREIVVDEAALERGIQDPTAERLKGYPPAMPAAPLSEADLRLVVDFIKELK